MVRPGAFGVFPTFSLPVGGSSRNAVIPRRSTARSLHARPGGVRGGPAASAPAGLRPGRARRRRLVLCEHPPTISVGRSGSRRTSRPMTTSCAGWASRCTGSIGAAAACSTCPASSPRTCALPLGAARPRPRALPRRAARRDPRRPRRSSTCRDRRGPAWPGVFLGHARVATVGVAVNRWIAYHGLTLNVGPYPGAVRR